MEEFEEWWARTGRTIDPDTEEVSWYDKRKSLAEAAFASARAQSTNYVCDDDTFPRKVTFANGRVVIIRERVDDPGRFFLGIGRVDGDVYLDPEKRK